MSDTERGEHRQATESEVVRFDWRDDGVLYAVNRAVFHPRGFALALRPDTGEFVLLGDGSEPWEFVDRPGEVTNAEREAAFAALLERAARSA